MKKRLQLSVLLFFSTVCSAVADMSPDSVGWKKSPSGNFIIHRIETAEGWFSIARQYGITYSELRLANKDSADKLVPGRTILVPLGKLKANDPHFDKNYIQDDELYYNVKDGETLFSIAKKFYTHVDSLKKWNSLAVTDLKPGQRLKVGFKSRLDGKEPESAEIKNSKTPEPKRDTVSVLKKVPEPLESKTVKTTPPPPRTDTSKVLNPKKDASAIQTKTIKTATPQQSDTTKIVKTASAMKNPDSKKSTQGSTKGRREVYETGVASWIRDDDINPNKYYALHRSAPIGTIIKVTNKMNNKYVFVKVVGTLPDTGDNNDLVIKISKASAEKLGVRDSKFQSELNYGVNEKP